MVHTTKDAQYVLQDLHTYVKNKWNCGTSQVYRSPL